MTYGDAREGKCRGNCPMEWVAITPHTTSERGVANITTSDAHTSAVSSRLNWRPCRFKWTSPFRRKTKSDFSACTITFQTQSTISIGLPPVVFQTLLNSWLKTFQISDGILHNLQENIIKYPQTGWQLIFFFFPVEDIHHSHTQYLWKFCKWKLSFSLVFGFWTIQPKIELRIYILL
jgi:hypothetical protein